MFNLPELLKDNVLRQLKDFRPFRKLKWHAVNPVNWPILRKKFPGWEERDAEYNRSGEDDG